MTPQKKSPVPVEKVVLYEKALATLPGAERKGTDNSYTSLNVDSRRRSAKFS